MQWLICYLTSSDNVVYTTSEAQRTDIQPYNAFLKFVETWRIINPQGFMDALNSYETILVNFEEARWEVFRQEVPHNVPFADLWKLNRPVETDPDADRPMVERAQEWIANFTRRASQARWGDKNSDFSNPHR